MYNCVKSIELLFLCWVYKKINYFLSWDGGGGGGGVISKRKGGGGGGGG